MTFEPKEVFWIDDVQTFELLADPTKVEILELTAVPHSVSEIAQAMGVPRTRLYHHVGALEEAGIIAVAATRQAGAMTEKLYQAAAKSYPSPFAWSSNESRQPSPSVSLEATNFPSEVGAFSTVTVVTTLSVEVSITVTESLPLFTTYTRVPAEFSATP